MDASQGLTSSEQVLSPEDVFIAVMGLTGVGKSTFVTLCTQKEIPIGHHLESCTSSVSIFSFQHKSQTVHLIDTPGFNDTTRSESEVLQEVAYWLSAAYGKTGTKRESRFLLNGIIYLHSIADVRWSASTRRSLNMLQTICGPENYDAIVLTTTFWDQVDKTTGNAREAQLLKDMNKWGQLVHGSPKSSVRRHDQGYKSAISIVDRIMERNVKYDLLIQKELAKPGATLYDTTAGREAQMLWEKDLERFQEELNKAKEAFDASQRRSDTAFTNEIQSLKSSITERKSALNDLLLPKAELESRWVSRNTREVEMLERKINECHHTIENLLKRASTPVDGGLSLFPLRTGDESAPSSSSLSTTSSSVESLLLTQERRRQKDLMAQKMAKLTARSLYAGAAGALFGGVSAGVSLLPYLASCSVM
ncbi:uncharacterized protein Z518_01211 [Rhinocladiella mackenziei CBS 650.93]|uniref:G domain-containing protein n=1 Tax=Rhinocladiella mackenziei CBS 650.93 TaxID=1442369 RepID=A0A0D2JKY9_9EURO|nr:uncharacterized protein Z518_01211 [Rhinocladiella mackenziei CBS 650.93]KIX10130.1 hypothetical protein Z518_01211 [Rhinocladiella mackenziei CBS 650.93]